MLWEPHFLKMHLRDPTSQVLNLVKHKVARVKVYVDLVAPEASQREVRTG